MPANEEIAPPIRVLLVEDNPGDARLIHELLLEAQGRFELETVPRLAQAMERLDSGRFQLVLLDLSLPDSSGVGSFRSVLLRFPHVPLIVLSGLDDEQLAVQTVHEGAQDYLVKGHVDHHTLVRAIRYALKRAEADRALAEERNLLRGVIGNLPDAVFVTDLSGHFLLDNLPHVRLLGKSSTDQVIGRTAFDFYPEAAAARIREEEREVIRTGLPILNREEVQPEALANSAASAAGREEVRWVSTTKVPLRDSEGEIIGVIGIGRDITERKRAEEQLFRYNEEIRERNAELEDDLHMAREIQQAFLPQQYPTFPRQATPAESALHFYSRYIPTTAVGGDFFHILPISDTRAGIFICDVMGHGVRAALVTAIQRALVEEMLPAANEPGRFLTEINRALLSILRRARTPMFASAFYLVVDVEEGRLSYANAGHPRPLHLHRDTGKLEFLASERAGPALGVFQNARYQTRSTEVFPHDLVVLFTDGLYEVEGVDETLFDQERLLEIIGRRLAAPPEDLIEKTISEIRDFAVNHAFEDDVCLVGVEIERVYATAASGAR